MSPGDYVVHIEHGIGLFRGLVTPELRRAWSASTCRWTTPRATGCIVPIYQVDRLSRYVGAGDAEPPLNRLGTADWARVKARARRAVEDIAEELLELYAARAGGARPCLRPR